MPVGDAKAEIFRKLGVYLPHGKAVALSFEKLAFVGAQGGETFGVAGFELTGSFHHSFNGALHIVGV